MTIYLGAIETVGRRIPYQVSLTAGRRYYFELEGSATAAGTLSDPFLRLLSGVNLLAKDNDGGVGLNSRMEYKPLTTGTYIVEVCAFGDNAIGTYRLTVDSDRTAPSQTISRLSLSADTGAAGDFITNASFQNITATLSAPLATAGGDVFVDVEWVQYSLDGGTTWSGSYSYVSGTAVSIDNVRLLSGANTLALRVVDEAGNAGPVVNQSYVLDTVAPGPGEITRISTTAGGGQANHSPWASETPVFSPDGTKVAFISGAKNLVAGDTNDHNDIFIKDIASGAITRISTTASGAQGNGNPSGPVFSPDGTKVLFSSEASNLVDGDTNGFTDIFVKDLATGAITRISTTASGAQGNSASYRPVFSPDATKVAFDSLSDNLVADDTNYASDIFVKDLATGAITRVSFDAIWPGGENGSSYKPAFSPDGTKLVFSRSASYLGWGGNIFIKDLSSGEITRVDTKLGGYSFNGNSYDPIFSPDGTKVLFRSEGSNLVDGDTNGTSDIFVKDLITGAITTISTAANGVQGTGDSRTVGYSGDGRSPVFSPDGTKVAFSSKASNLVAQDYNDDFDIFVKDLVSGAITRVTNAWRAGGSFSPAFSPDGMKLVFSSDASTLVDGDTNTSRDIFVWDMRVRFSSLALSVDNGRAGDFITNTALQTITATLADELATASGSVSAESVQFSLDGGTNWSGTGVSVSGTTLRISGATLLSGANTLSLRLVDVAGNAGPVLSQSYVVDTFAPTTTIVGLSLSADTGTAGDFITSTAVQTITATLGAALATASGPVSAESVQFSVDGGATWSGTGVSVSGTAVSISGVPLLSGANTLALRLVDAAGNAGTVAGQSYFLDTAPGITSGGTVSFAENATGIVYTATGNDPEGAAVNFTLGGADASLFNFNSATGAVTFKTAPNFEAPADAGANNIYDVTVTASDGSLSSAARAVAITVTNVNEFAPSITSGGTAGFAENATGNVYIATGSDADAGTTLTYMLGGTDAGLFNINAATGAVTFKTAPNFEAPADAGANNVYDITVTASDGSLSSGARVVAITVTNVNDDVLSLVRLQAARAEGLSGSTAFTFLATRTGDVTAAGSVSWTVTGGTAGGTVAANGADFVGGVLPSGVVSFAAGQASNMITVNVAGDTAAEGGFNESFSLTLANPSGGMTLGTPSAVGLIYNDDSPGTGTLAIARSSAQKAEGQSGTSAFTFTVTRAGDLTGTAGADWAVTGGGVSSTVSANAADFAGGILPSGRVNFAAGQGLTTITINVAADSTIELNDSFTVTLAAPQLGVTIGTATATGVILNDDFPPSGVLSIAGLQADRGEGASGSTAFTFVVTRAGSIAGPASANWAAAAGTASAADFTGGILPSGSVTFAPGQASQVVTLTVAGDTAAEADETFTVSLSGVPTGVSIGTATATGTIRNDDPAGTGSLAIARASAQKAEGASGTTPFTFTVTRSGDLSGVAAADWAVSGGSVTGTTPATGADFATGQFPSGRVSFAAGQAVQAVAVNVNADMVAELNESFTIALSNAQAGVSVATPTATGVIINDDFVSTAANQTLTGTDAPDVFLLGGGLDSVVAKAGLDVFRFLPTAIGPAASNAATLQDFSRVAGEVLDLSAIDAVAGTLADDPFSFIGSAAFNGTPGQLRWQDQGGGTLLIQGNINNETVADLTILVKAAGPVDASWFTL